MSLADRFDKFIFTHAFELMSEDLEEGSMFVILTCPDYNREGTKLSMQANGQEIEIFIADRELYEMRDFSQWGIFAERLVSRYRLLNA